MTEAPTTVPRAKVEALAANIKELFNLKAHQSQIQAKLIRWCVQAMTREPRGHFDYHQDRKERKEIKENKAKALLYLDWLATQMENNASGNLTETPDAP